MDLFDSDSQRGPGSTETSPSNSLLQGILNVPSRRALNLSHNPAERRSKHLLSRSTGMDTCVTCARLCAQLYCFSNTLCTCLHRHTCHARLAAHSTPSSCALPRGWCRTRPKLMMGAERTVPIAKHSPCFDLSTAFQHEPYQKTHISP